MYIVEYAKVELDLSHLVYIDSIPFLLCWIMFSNEIKSIVACDQCFALRTVCRITAELLVFTPALRVGGGSGCTQNTRMLTNYWLVRASPSTQRPSIARWHGRTGKSTGWLPVWKVASSNFNWVKPMTYKIDTCHSLPRLSLRINMDWLM